MGDGNFAGAVSPNYVFNVTRASVDITSGNETVVYNHNGTVTIWVNNTKITGTLILHINGQNITVNLNGTNRYIVPINSSGWSFGSYIFNVTYVGDGNFTGAVAFYIYHYSSHI